MSAHGYHRGHHMVFDQDADVWRYTDTREPVPDNPERKCGHCKLPNRADGHDACLGHLPGVMNACCGHGIDDEAYVQFPDSTSVRGRAAKELLELLAAGKP